jgi:hypothetical protein
MQQTTGNLLQISIKTSSNPQKEMYVLVCLCVCICMCLCVCVCVCLCVLLDRVRDQIEQSKLAFIPVYTKANGKLRKWVTFQTPGGKKNVQTRKSLDLNMKHIHRNWDSPKYRKGNRNSYVIVQNTLAWEW